MPDLLRETFETYAQRAPSADGLREAVDARVRRGRSRRRWTYVTTAAATAAAVVAGIVVAGGEPGAAPGPRTPLAAEPPAPDGMAWAMWKGVEVMVPEAWLTPKFDACGVPQTDAVLAGPTPADGDCMGYPMPHIDVVMYDEPDGYIVAAMTEGRDVVVSGVPARRLTGRGSAPVQVGGEQHAEALVIPERNVAVLVTTDDPAVAARVLGTVRISRDADSRGCAIRRELLARPAPPARDGTAERMVPGTPVQASVCRYGINDGWVYRSALVVDGVAALAAEFDQLNVGATASASSGPFLSFYVVTFRYAEGPDVEVYVGRAEHRFLVSNGAITIGEPGGVGEALRPLVGWRFWYDEKVDWSYKP